MLFLLLLYPRIGEIQPIFIKITGRGVQNLYSETAGEQVWGKCIKLRRIFLLAAAAVDAVSPGRQLQESCAYPKTCSDVSRSPLRSGKHPSM